MNRGRADGETGKQRWRSVLGLDVGGANLKAANGAGRARQWSFALWKEPERLAAEIASLLGEFPEATTLAVAMTGELADGYASKRDGVRAIVASVLQAAGERACWFWQTGGSFVTADEARDMPRAVAAANWHALASWCGEVVGEGSAILLDIGSTTTDVIPIVEGRCAARGLTDPERLAAGELVYTGASRTPLCAFGTTIEWRRKTFGLAAEFFATMRDVFLILGEEPEDFEDCQSADGRPASVAHARSRLARMLCADPEELDDLRELAAIFARRQRKLIQAALRRVRGRVPREPVVILSGSGSRIGRATLAAMPQFAQVEVIDLERRLGAACSGAACAYALARLGEGLSGD